MVGNNNDRFLGDSQQDANEFFQGIIDCMEVDVTTKDFINDLL